MLRLDIEYDLLPKESDIIHNHFWDRAFELLLLAYGAYLTFFQFCQAAFPDMGTQIMTQMIAGYDTTMFRPDDELKRFRKYIREPYGMVLVTGPTGSGKSSTLAAILAATSTSATRPRWCN